MNRQEIEEIVIEIIAEELSIDTSEINLDSTFKDLGADSLDEMEIMIHIEKKFISLFPTILQQTLIMSETFVSL